MADANVEITEGVGTSVDTRTEADNGNHRQVIVIGDPSVTDGVAPVDDVSGLKVTLGADNAVTVTGVATAANQAAGNTSVGNVDTNLGAKADAVASSDTGTFSLIALVKRVAQWLTTIAGYNQSLAGTVSGSEIQADIVAALPAGTNNIGDVDIASALPAGNNNIGDVDVASLPAIPAGNNNIGDVDIASLPNEGQQTMANSISVAVASDQTPLTTQQVTRANKVHQITTITSSTSETTVLTAAASTYHDVYGVIVTNTSATPTEVSFKDDTGGTTRFTVSAPANDTRGLMLSPTGAFTASATNKNWTATCADSVASIIITVLAVKNT